MGVKKVTKEKLQHLLYNPRKNGNLLSRHQKKRGKGDDEEKSQKRRYMTERRKCGV